MKVEQDADYPKTTHSNKSRRNLTEVEENLISFTSISRDTCNLPSFCSGRKRSTENTKGIGK